MKGRYAIMEPYEPTADPNHIVEWTIRQDLKRRLERMGLTVLEVKSADFIDRLCKAADSG